MLYDLFICHASEDKDTFVRPLATLLRTRHIEVWYDEFSLQVGDSLRRSIDHGLGSSRYGVVVLSRAFFAKRWPQYELDGLVEREMSAGSTVLLPVWFGVSHADVIEYSAPLAGRVALLADRGVETVAAELAQRVKPQGSPLVVARDFLLDYQVEPPVVTDEFWLDVAEASNRVEAYGAAIPETSTWDRWSFPLPEPDGTVERRGERLGWTALQLAWTRRADAERIDITTPYREVIDFIETSPGLEGTCAAFPSLLAEYAPQLTILGFGGPLEDVVQEAYEKSLEKSAAIDPSSVGGTGLTVTGRRPLCSSAWALRHPTFADYDAPTLANEYFHGGMFGPPVAIWEDTDHLFWLLSANSGWLPEPIRATLLDGLARNHGTWLWHGPPRGEYDAPWSECGRFAEELTGKRLRQLSKRALRDAVGRAAVARTHLHLTDSPETLVELLVAADVPGRFRRENPGGRRKPRRSTPAVKPRRAPG